MTAPNETSVSVNHDGERRKRLRELATKLVRELRTDGCLEGVMAAAVIELLDETENTRAADAVEKGEAK